MAWSRVVRTVLPLAVLAGFIYAAYLVAGTSPEMERKRSVEKPRISVQTRVIEGIRQPVSIESFGVVQPRTQTVLVAQVSGQIIAVSPSFRAGGYFNRGDVLLQIDPVDYEVQVEISEGELVEAELALAEEEARVRQARKDWEKIGSQDTASELALRLPYLKAAQARVATAQARLTQARINLDRTRIRAPYSGRVLTKSVDIGTVVAPQLQVGEIYATDYVEIRLPLKSSDLSYLDLPEPGNASGAFPRVILTNQLINPHQLWEGRIVRTEGTIDTASQQLYVIAQVDDPFALEGRDRYPLKIGQYVSASIEGRPIPNALVVPSSAIYQGSYLYLVKDDVLVRRNIETGWQGPRDTLIVAGLEAGDEVVLTTLGQVSSGIPVARLDSEVNAATAKRPPLSDATDTATP